jgi:hypothetical protein
MFCKQCGTKIPDDAGFCPSCGKEASKQSPPMGALPQQHRPVQPTPQTDTEPPHPGGDYPPQTQTQGAGQPAFAADSLDFGRIFSYLFQDPTWITKVLMLSLMLIIPIVGWIVIIGYYVETVQNIAEGRDIPLPQFDFSRHLSSGFTYFLPALCLGLACGAINIVLTFLIKIPIAGILFGLANFALQILFTFYGTCAFSLAIVNREPWLLFQFNKCFNALKSNFLNVFLALLINIPIGLIAFAGIIGIGIGILFTIPLSWIMQAQVSGQLGRILKKSVD